MRNFLILGAASSALAYDQLFKFNSTPEVETRSIEDIHKVALAEGGVVTLWHGGDEVTQQDELKSGFEKAFPGMTLNVTVDLSKYHNGNIDEQLANNNVCVDSVILQTLQDYPRWAEEGALLNYAPLGFDEIDPAYKDSTSAAWYGIIIFSWSFIWNPSKLGNATFATEFPTLLDPMFKDKIVLTYPNDDDAVLYAFDQVTQQYGTAWFDALLLQNPRWVRGTQTPSTLIAAANSSSAITFTGSTAAILKDAPNPEGAKLLHSYMLTKQYQEAMIWSVRQDVQPPASFELPEVALVDATNAPSFARWMGDRERVERLRFWFEGRIGSAQGLSPLIDDL